MTDRRIALYVSIACAAYAVAMIATIPSSYVADAIARLSRQSLQLRDPQGSAWTGNGRLYMQRTSGGLVELGILRWNASLRGSLGGKFVTELRLGDEIMIERMELGRTSMVLHGLQLEVPGAVLEDFVPGLSALGPRGTLRLRSENLRVQEDEFLGNAQIEWRPAQLAAARGVKLGSHVARLSGGGRRIDIQLATIEGPLALHGGGAWTPDGGLVVSGSVEHGDDQAALAPLLQGICGNYVKGKCSFRVQR